MIYKFMISVILSLYVYKISNKYTNIIRICSSITVGIIFFIYFCYFNDIIPCFIFLLLLTFTLLLSSCSNSLKIQYAVIPDITLTIIQIYQISIQNFIPETYFNHAYLMQKMIITYFIQIMIFTIMLFLALKYFERISDIDFTKWYTSIISLILLFIFHFILYLLKNTDSFNTSVFIVTISLCIFSLLMIYIQNISYKYHIQKEKDDFENTLLKQEIKLNKEYLHSQEELHILKHDVQHLLTTLSESNNQNIKEEVEETFKTLDSLPIPFNTGNKVLDIVLNIKKETALKKNIEFICTINTSNFRISDDDLSLIMINLLDNAINHIGQRKRIEVIIKEINDNLSIKVINSIDKQLHLIKDVYTLPFECKNGYGIKTICKIVQKYDGIVDYSQIEDLLTATIIIPNN